MWILRGRWDLKKEKKKKTFEHKNKKGRKKEDVLSRNISKEERGHERTRPLKNVNIKRIGQNLLRRELGAYSVEEAGRGRSTKLSRHGQSDRDEGVSRRA